MLFAVVDKNIYVLFEMRRLKNEKLGNLISFFLSDFLQCVQRRIKIRMIANKIEHAGTFYLFSAISSQLDDVEF